METSVAPFLMFEGRAEEAMTLYVSLVPGSRIIDIKRYGTGQNGPEGSVMLARFSVGGLTVMCSDSPVHHAFSFTPSTPSSSLFVTCATEQDIDRLANELGRGGQVLMALGNYGFSRKFTWFNDRFGVSWQLNLE